MSSKRQKQNRGGNGRWTKTEHDRFLKGLERYGRDWVSVQKVVKTRSLVQVRSHAQKVFMKMEESDIQALIGEYYEFESMKSLSDERLSVTDEEISFEERIESHSSPKEPAGNLLHLFKQALKLEGATFELGEKHCGSSSLNLEGQKQEQNTQTHPAFQFLLPME